MAGITRALIILLWSQLKTCPKTLQWRIGGLGKKREDGVETGGQGGRSEGGRWRDGRGEEDAETWVQEEEWEHPLLASKRKRHILVASNCWFLYVTPYCFVFRLNSMGTKFTLTYKDSELHIWGSITLMFPPNSCRNLSSAARWNWTIREIWEAAGWILQNARAYGTEEKCLPKYILKIVMQNPGETHKRHCLKQPIVIWLYVQLHTHFLILIFKNGLIKQNQKYILSNEQQPQWLHSLCQNSMLKESL